MQAPETPAQSASPRSPAAGTAPGSVPSPGVKAAAPRRPQRQSASGPERLRRFLERRGPPFVKLGQFLALRPDLIPQVYCDELLHLLDHGPEFSWEEARRILTEDLGEEPERLFQRIDPKPVAAASMAQVHLATTHEGKLAAVKIQRPRLREQIDRAMRAMRLLLRLLRVMGVMPIIPADELQAELRRWFEAELDFGLELKNLTRMYRRHEGDPHVRIPRPYPALSGRRVVTCEYLQGVRFSQLIQWIQRGEAQRLEEHGLDREALAKNLGNALLEQIFRKELFQADPHPGNLIALPGNQIGFVDFGLVEQPGEAFQAVLARSLVHVYTGDAQRMHAALMELLIPGKHANAEAFRVDFLARTQVYAREKTEPAHFSEGEKSPLARYLLDLMQSARTSGYSLPSDVLAVYRALLTAETVLQRLRARTSLRLIGRRFFRRLEVDNALRSLEAEEFQQTGLHLLALFQEAPGHLQRLLSDLASERFLLHVRTTQSREDGQEASARARLIAAAIISVGLAVLLVGAGTLPLVRESRASVPVLGALLVAIYLWIFLLWRRLS